jgi:hypothetical protein
MRYRIKQVSSDIFIPQCREYFFLQWGSIDNINNYAWNTTEKYSHNKTYDEAFKVIENYKKYLRTKNKYPKYYKV